MIARKKFLLWFTGGVFIAVLLGIIDGIIIDILLSLPKQFLLALPFLVFVLICGYFFLRKWPKSAILFLIVTAMLTRYRYDVGSISVRPEHVAVVIVGLIAITRFVLELGRIWIPWPAIFLLIWWGANFLASLFSPDIFLGVQNSLRLAVMVIIFILLINLIPNYSTWRWSVIVFLVVGILEAGFGILARVLYEFGINWGVQVAYRFSTPVPYGTFEEGNLFGSQCAVWGIILVSLLLGNLSTGKKALITLPLFVIMAALVLSMSRAAWITFGAGATIVWVVMAKDGNRRIIRLGMVMVAVPLSIFFLFLSLPLLPNAAVVERISSFLDLKYDFTWSARLSDWSLAWQDWLQRPLLGWGPGSFYMLHGILRFRPAWISNLTLRLLQESGLVGAISFLLFFGYSTLGALRTTFQTQLGTERQLLLGLVISYVVLLGLAYQSTDGIWLAASWIHASLLFSGAWILRRESSAPHTHEVVAD